MARALLTSARDFRHGLERKSVIRRSQQSRLYLDMAHVTLETVKQVTLERTIKIRGAVVTTVPKEHEHEDTTMGMIPSSDAISKDTVSQGVPAGAFTMSSLAPSAPIRGPTLQVVLDRPQSSLPSPPDEQSQEPAAPYYGSDLVSTGAAKETKPSINPAIGNSPLPTPPLTPETPVLTQVLTS